MKQRIVTLIGITALALTIATAAFGAAIVPQANVTAGSLSINLPSAPSASFTLDGTDQTTSLAAILGVVDATGSGAGWNVTEAATTFTSGAHSLAAPTLTSASAACKAGNSCTNATNAITGYPLTLNTTAIKVFNAAANTGLGKVDVTTGLGISVPGNAFAGTYSSTVTISLVSGP